MSVDRQLEEQLRKWAGGVLSRSRDLFPVPSTNNDTLKLFMGQHGVTSCLRQYVDQETLYNFGGMFETEPSAVAVELARKTEFTKQMPRILASLSSPPLVFKGQALAYNLYPQPWMRPRGDVDILVKATDVQDTVKLLEQLGYNRPVAIDADLIMQQVILHRYQLGIEHVWDVHRKISNRPALADALSYEQLLESAVEVPIDDIRFVAPNTVYNLLIACVHLIGHHANEVRLIWLYDIHLLVEKLSEGEREQFLEKAKGRPDVRAVCHTALDLTRQYLPADRTDSLWQALDPGAGARRRLGRSYLSRLFEDARALNMKQRRVFVKQHLFPSADYMVKRFGIRHRWQLPFWYAVRIGRAVPKLFRRR